MTERTNWVCWQQQWINSRTHTRTQIHIWRHEHCHIVIQTSAISVSVTVVSTSRGGTSASQIPHPAPTPIPILTPTSTPTPTLTRPSLVFFKQFFYASYFAIESGKRDRESRRKSEREGGQRHMKRKSSQHCVARVPKIKTDLRHVLSPAPQWATPFPSRAATTSLFFAISS